MFERVLITLLQLLHLTAAKNIQILRYPSSNFRVPICSGLTYLENQTKIKISQVKMFQLLFLKRCKKVPQCEKVQDVKSVIIC